MKRLKLFFACLLMAVLSIGQVWGTEAVYKQTIFSADNNEKGVQNYTSTWTNTTDGFIVTTVNANNNNNGWSGAIKIGTKTNASTGTITTNAAIDKAITKVTLTIDAITYPDNVTSITLKTSSNGSSWTSAGTFTKEVGAKTVTLASPTADLYYQIEVICTGASKNGCIQFSQIDFYAEEGGGGGSSNPTVSLDPDDALNFATVGVEDPAPTAQSFTITGSNMTAALSIADLTNFDYSVTSGSLSPSEGSISATVTVTPKSGFTASAGDKSETLTISGDDLEDDIELALNAEVKAKHNINFDTDLKSIANVSVIEGETYNITETIEAALIASCTYTKFEGWTTVSSIADASVKPSLVSSVTMSTTDVTLKPVFSVTTGGGGSSEKTAHLTESEMRNQLNSSATAYTTATETSYDDTSDGVEWAGKFSANAGSYWVQLRQNATPAYLKISADGNISEVKVTVTSASNKSGGQYNMTTGYNNFNSSVNLYLSTENVAGSENANVVATAATGTGISYIELTLTPSSADNSELYLISSGGCRVWLVDVTYSTGGGGTTTYSLDPGCAAAGQCYAPTFSPAAGTFDVAQNVELACTTDGATIRYTIDGSTPSKTVGTVYSSAIAVSANTTIKAIAYKDGMEDSEISEGVFNIRCAQPTFGPTAGEYTTAQNVTISADGADHIYYTLNGNDPVPGEEGTSEYTAAISINTTGSHTIKAIAVKAGYANSNVASATYEMDLPYANIAAFITAKPTTAKSLTLNNAIITGVDGTTLYIQDETAGIMIYGLATLPENAAPNHSISGTIVGKYSSYKNQHELVKPNNTTPIDISNVTISADEVARPAISEYTSLSAAYEAKPMMLVKLTGVSYDGTQYEFSGNKIYNTFEALTEKTMPETTVDCDITGIVIDFNGTLELLPVFATDIVADADAADPTASPAGGADAENAVTAAAVEITAAADTKVDGLASKTVDINSTTPVEVFVTVTRDFYRSVNFSCGWYKATAAKYNINGQGATTKGAVVAKVAGVEAATAAEGDEVHVFITPNAHFHFESITINKNEGTVATTQVAEGTEYSFTMPDEAVTIAVTYTQDQQATLTFAKGEATGTEDAPTAITDYVGETVQLPANPFTYSGHKFIGWSCDGGATKLAAGTDYQLAENKDFVAYWAAIPTFNDADHEWQLATSLEAGKYYVIGSASQDKTASKTISGGYMSEIDSEIEDGVIAYNALGANTAIFLLGGNSTDGWTLTEVTTDNVLGTTANKNVSWNAGTQTWAISIAEGGNATIGGTSRILHNVNSTRFTTYDSNTSASMLLPQLYVWTEKAFKLRYDANGGTNAPTATPAAAGKATVTDEQPTAPAGKIFDGWNENELGTGKNYAAGDEVDVTTTDVTIYAKWRDPNTYTVSYDANEGEGTMDADADQEEGSLYTIKPNEFTREGYGFAGWKAYDALDNELTITNGKFYIPTSNVTVKAQWNEIVTTNFVLVGNVNQLNAGDEVYIVAAASNNAMGAQDNVNYRSRVEIDKTADNGRVIITGTAPVKFTLGKDGDNFTFFDGEGYLCATSSSSNNMGTQETLNDEGKWSISINANGEATIIAQGNYTRNHMRYNDNNNQERFSCYASTSTMPKVAIYKKASAEVIRGELSNGKWGTICPKQTVENATGATFYQISYLEEQNGLPFNMVFDPITGTTLTAGQPYFFIATGEEITGIKVGVELSEADDAGVNGFYGYIGDGVKALSWKTDYVAGENNTFVIYNNTVMRLNAATNLKSERCYININATEPTRVDPTPGAAPRRRVVVGVSGTNVATGIDALNASETPVKMIIDGQLYILRGEKMYDATGKLVK
jgi:uncharacterized repeat protein (TIGR02543 family)